MGHGTDRKIENKFVPYLRSSSGARKKIKFNNEVSSLGLDGAIIEAHVDDLQGSAVVNRDEESAFHVNKDDNRKAKRNLLQRAFKKKSLQKEIGNSKKSKTTISTKPICVTMQPTTKSEDGLRREL